MIKRIGLLVMLLSTSYVWVYSQTTAPLNWFNLDMKKDKFPGTSTTKAYQELLKGKKSKTVIVAVIDGGTDPLHEDLAVQIWTNGKELAENGIDDDKNGYIDDIHGWNFIGGKSGKDVEKDNLELTRVYSKYKQQFSNGDDGSDEYKLYTKIKSEYEQKNEEAKNQSKLYKEIVANINSILKSIGTDEPTKTQLESYKPTGTVDKLTLDILLKSEAKKVKPKDLLSQINPAIEYFDDQLAYHLNVDLNTRGLVEDNYENVNERFYGNNHYKGPEANHGTHVAGIIAAVRNNNIGMDGIAQDVKIMIVRVVPNGDERDKDVANGIRYATDNGAQIINMSFGKSYSPYKSAVDEAVKYAESKNVLIVHAAGNDHKNIDTMYNFPTRKYQSSTTEAANWIEVGASSWKKGKLILGDFSNYGKNNVDVFSPGVDIYSTLPNNTYGSYNGTSMAAPVTAGIAALLLSYYPNLTAVQLKEIILKSAVPIKGKVVVPGQPKLKMKAKDLSRTGALVNTFKAVQLAETMTK